MVKLSLFIVEERLPTLRALAVLSLGDLLFAGSPVFGFGRLSLRPVVLETWVIGRCGAFDQRVPFDREPTQLEPVFSGLFVAKCPGVQPVHSQSSPGCLFEPVHGFGGVSLLGVAQRFVEHPLIQLAKDFFRHSDAQGVCPPSDDRVESGQHGWRVRPFASVPFFLSLLLHRFYRFFARFDEHFPSCS